MNVFPRRQSVLNKGMLKTATCIVLAAGLGIPNAYASPNKLESMSAETIQQQGVTVKGVVKDSAGEPIIGANVVEKGTTNGMITDLDGNFSLTVKSAQSILVISYIGYKSQEIPVGANRNIDITLQDDSQLMDEVVVIGYGTQKKADVTSSIASVKAESFNKGAIRDAGQLVQGKVAGLQISMPSGDPSQSTSVMLRGTSTLKGNTNPLILIDGVPGSFSTVAAEDIESIDVLKDGSATAIYGTRGTNGVIIITTKGVRRDMPTTIEYNGYVSVSNWARKADFMNSSDLRQRWAEGYSFSGANDQDYGADTNWLDEISRTGISNVHNLTFRGGSKSTSMIANLTYDNKQGTMKKSDVKNIRGRVEVQHRMFDDKLTTTLSIIANERNTGLYFKDGDNDGPLINVYRYACIQNPTQPVYDEKGDYVERAVYFYDNPVSLLNERDGMNRNRNVRMTGTMEFRPIESLAIKGMYTRRGQSYLQGTYYTHKDPSTTESGYNGYASRYTTDGIYNNAELTADWHQSFDQHNLGAIVGYSYEDNTYESFYASNRDFPTDSYTYNKLESGLMLSKGEAGMSSYKEKTKLIGLIARVTYNYEERYLLMAALRHEGSSKFGTNHKWGTFPSLSAGWRISSEKFMKDVKWIDNLKLRAGYGVTGTNAGNPYESQASLNYENYFLYNGSWINTLIPARNANPDLRWEKKLEYNAGFDFEFLKGRLSGSFDVYRRDTKDAMWDYSVPMPPYQYGTMDVNVGKIRNTGFEMQISAVPYRTKGFEWNTNITFPPTRIKWSPSQMMSFN